MRIRAGMIGLLLLALAVGCNGGGAAPATPPPGPGTEPHAGTGTEPQAGPGAEPQAGTGTEPQAGTGTEPQAGTGEEPQARTGEEPQAGTGAEPQAGTGEEPQAGTGEEPQPPPAGELPKIALERFVDGLSGPISLTHAGDGSGRLYVIEQAGRIRLIEEGKLLPEPFLDLTDRVLATGMEQGLLGLAFAPDYASSGLFYVHYSGQNRGETVISRFRRSKEEPRRGDPASEEILLTEPQPYTNHNGGAIAFGPDGYLYIALGDGGSGGDPGNRAQNKELLLGKILRIDVSQPGTYRIPQSNPFVNQAGKDEIWAYGLRNPWRIAFDRATGDLWIADVGQNEIEEINFQPASSKGGENYGWRLYEGSKRFGGGNPPADLALPVAEYTHEEGGCSVTGGTVYRGAAYPQLTGIYFYADFCTGKIWGVKQADGRWVNQELLDTESMIAAFGEDEQGEIYVVDRKGSLLRLRAE